MSKGISITNQEAFGLQIGCVLLPRKMPGTLAFKVKQIKRKVAPIIEDLIETKAEFIKDNYKRVQLPTGEKDDEGKEKKNTFAVKVDEQFVKFLDPLYQLPERKQKMDELKNPIFDDEGRPMFEDEDEELTKTRDERKTFLRIMDYIENDKKFTDYWGDIMKLETTIEVAKLDINDFLGVEFGDRNVLDFFEPILKI